MEEIRRAAGASYEHLPAKDKKMAIKNFNAMDKNRDGQISLREYMAYLKRKKATDLSPQSIFSALDKDNNGSLDFEEAFLLFYIMESGRALFCKSCNTFMPGAYFSCCQCFFKVDVKSTYEICCDCYGGKMFTHHDGATFCDNYTLLSQSRSAIQEAPSKKRSKVLKILKMGLQIAAITIGLGGIIYDLCGGDGVGTSGAKGGDGAGVGAKSNDGVGTSGAKGGDGAGAKSDDGVGTSGAKGGAGAGASDGGATS